MDKNDGLFDKNNEIEENEEYDPEIYTLTDEEGNELHFALLGTLEHNGETYKALIPVNEDGEEESSEYVILKCSVDENGEDIITEAEGDADDVVLDDEEL